MKRILEICIDSFESAQAAAEGGADRVEVCSALSAGGTTPSISLINECVRNLGMPAMVMIRPHEGDFVYSKDDIRVMIGNIKAAKEAGVQGVVFGALLETGDIDTDNCQRLLDAAEGLETTFHRAIDVVNDPLKAMAQLESMGFNRVLTSGQKQNAIQGANLIAQMQQHAKSLKIIAGAGINAENVHELIAATGVTEVHASASVCRSPQGNKSVTFGEQRRVSNVEKIRKLRQKLDLAVPC